MKSEWRNIPYDQKDLLISLPYKLGIWIGHYDEQGDVKADEKERAALSEIIEYLAEDSTSTSFVTELFRDALNSREDWADWPCNEQQVLEDSKKGMKIVKDNVSDKDATAFREALLTVCEVVAQAYGEFGGLEDDESSSKWFGAVRNAIEKLKGHSYVNMERPFNISPAEQEAISTLKTQLESV